MLELTLICSTAALTHFLMSFCQTLFHYRLGHRRLGGRLFRNHISFHHVYYAKDHLVSTKYLADKGNNTPFFLVPSAVAAIVVYFVLPLDLFVVLIAAMSASFYAHVYLDKQYHIAGSWLVRFGWFRRKQQLHFVHHRHANSNFAVIDYFWDRLLGTYRDVESVSRGSPTNKAGLLPPDRGCVAELPLSRSQHRINPAGSENEGSPCCDRVASLATAESAREGGREDLRPTLGRGKGSERWPMRRGVAGQ